MTPAIFIVLALLVAAVLVFAFEWLPVDVTTLALLAALVLTGILTVEEAFSGFSNEIIVILAAIFILSGALMKAGVLDHLGGAIHRVAGGSLTRTLLCVMPITAFVSAFMNNTTTTAVLMPAVLGVCKRSKISPSQVLIPLAFASMLGGTCTLIGTSTNVAASGVLRARGLPPFALFEFLPVGLAAVGAGILYMVTVGRWLLPKHAESSYIEEYQIREYLAEVVVTHGSPLAGRTIGHSRLAEKGLTVIAVLRGGQRFAAGARTRLEEGDLLIVKAGREALLQVKEAAGIEIKPDLQLADQDLISPTMKIVEAILMPQSSLLGRTIKELDFRHRFGVTVIAIYRRGHAVPRKIGTLPLEVGDVLLLQGSARAFQALDTTDLLVLDETEHLPGKRRRGLYVVGLFLAAVLASGLDLIPLPIAFLLAALGVVAFRLMTMEEAYNFIDWRLLILIAGMTAFGVAMQKTEAAEYLAGLVVGIAAPLGVPFIMAGFVVLTMLLTQPMSNAAAALVVLPVAMSAAGSLGVEPRSFAVLVTLAASLSFITPFEPSCLIVYGPGKYRFRDFMIAGLPLSILIGAVLLLLVPLFWPAR